MRYWMKSLAFSSLIVLSSLAANADSVDPTIIIRDPVSCPSRQCVSVPGLSFTFGVPRTGFGVLHFLNASGVTWHSLMLTEIGVPAVEVHCVSSIFSCSVVALNQNGAKIILTAIKGMAGIPSGHGLEITLGCKGGNCPLWPPGLDFSAVANIPEPATLALVATGVLAMRMRRRKALRS